MTTEEHVKHTPGPWTWRESEDTKEGSFGPLCLEDEACNMVISADLHVDVLTGAMHLGISVTDAHANLIAAAPELLAACKALVQQIDNGSSLTGSEVQVENARAAIAKADGKE